MYLELLQMYLKYLEILEHILKNPMCSLVLREIISKLYIYRYYVQQFLIIDKFIDVRKSYFVTDLSRMLEKRIILNKKYTIVHSV